MKLSLTKLTLSATLVLNFILSSGVSHAQVGPSRRQVEREMQKAIEAQNAEQAQEEEEQLDIFEAKIVPLKDNTKDISPEGKEAEFDNVTEYMSNAFVGLYPALMSSDLEEHFQKQAEKRKTSNNDRFKIQVMPGDADAALYYLQKASNVSLNKVEAVDLTLKTNKLMIKLINSGFASIKLFQSKITLDDMQNLFDNQIKATQEITKTFITDRAPFFYYKSVIYSLMFECIYNALLNYQDILKTEIEKNNGLVQDIVYKDRTPQLNITIKGLKLRLNDIVSQMQRYIEIDRKDKLFTRTEKKINELHNVMRYYFIYNNILKTELFIYRIANTWDFIRKSPLMEKSIKISKNTYTQDKIHNDFLSAADDVVTLYDFTDLPTRQELLQTTIKNTNHIFSKMKIFAIKSILNMVNSDFSGSGIFTKEYRYVTLYNYFNNNIIKFSDQTYDNSFINLEKLLTKNHIAFDINLRKKTITTSITLKEEAITNPFFRHMSDYFLEIQTFSDKDYKNIDIKIGKFTDGKFNGIVVNKTSSILKPGFEVGFDKKDRSGYTQILKVKNNVPIEAEFKSFESIKGTTYSKEFLLVSNDDGQSSVDIDNQTIIGNGKSTLTLFDYSTNKSSKTKWFYDNSEKTKAE